MKLFEDTDLKTEGVYVDLLSKCSSAKKTEILCNLYSTAISMIDHNIQRNNSFISDEDLVYKRTEFLFGTELAKKIYDKKRYSES